MFFMLSMFLNDTFSTFRSDFLISRNTVFLSTLQLLNSVFMISMFFPVADDLSVIICCDEIDVKFKFRIVIFP